MFLTCVTTILHSAALLVLMYSSRMYCGTCVVLPQPVAPRITTTELWHIASRISLSKFFTGKVSLSCWIWKKIQHISKNSKNQPILLHIRTLSHSSTQVSLTQRKNCIRRKYKLWFVLHSATYSHIHPSITLSNSENLVHSTTEIQSYTLCITLSASFEKEKD